jgi:pheromone shutdown protein TraB
MRGAEFDARWQTVPRWQRALLRGAVGAAVAGQAAFGDRWLQLVLEHSTLDDLPTNRETLAKDPMPDIERVVLDERDERLVAALVDLHERRHDEQAVVAVTYGAEHMRAVVTQLNRRFGYRVRAGEWLTVVRRG